MCYPRTLLTKISLRSIWVARPPTARSFLALILLSVERLSLDHSLSELLQSTYAQWELAEGLSQSTTI